MPRRAGAAVCLTAPLLTLCILASTAGAFAAPGSAIGACSHGSLVPFPAGATDDSSLQSVSPVDTDSTLRADSSALADSLRPGSARPSLGDRIVEDLATIGLDGLAYLSAPARWDLGEWGLVAGTIALTGATMSQDEAIRREVRAGSYAPWAVSVLTHSSEYGDIRYANVATAALWVTGLVIDDDDVRATGRMLAQSLLYSGALTMSLRYLFGRQRPYKSESAWEFETFQSSNEVQSFPSGHTTVAFAVSSVLARRIDHPVASVILYGAATLTGASRIYLDRHWTSDVVLGAAIGLASGLFVADREQERLDAASSTPGGVGGLHVMPTPTGLALVYRF